MPHCLLKRLQIFYGLDCVRPENVVETTFRDG